MPENMRVLTNAGAPGAGTAAVWTLTIGGAPASGTFKLKYGSEVTADITWSNVNATLVAAIDAALEALPRIGTGGVVTAVASMTSGVGTITITFAAKKPSLTFSVHTNATSGTISIAQTTPGVAATLAPKGSLIVDTTNAILYINAGTAAAPTWTNIKSQA